MIEYRRDIYKLFDEFGLIGEVAEIGVAEAYFSEQISTWDQVTKVWMVDNWGTIEDQKGDGSNPQSWHDDNYMKAHFVCEKNIKCKMLQGLSATISQQFKSESLIMVYLDADHSYEGVHNDLHFWFDKVKQGGIIAGHDYLNEGYGVKQAIDKFCVNRFNVNVIPETDPTNSSFWFRKL